jgi:protein-L-isoaspartate(D-aspartate) O-methyltransferase
LNAHLSTLTNPKASILWSNVLQICSGNQQLFLEKNLLIKASLVNPRNFLIGYLWRTMMDTFKHKGLRRKLIDELQKKGNFESRILEAMMLVPRHLFLDSSFLQYAYQDKAFPIAAGQTISHPYTVAFQTQLLNPQKRDKILEIGTGSGYQTAVLNAIGARVYSVERQKELFLSAKKLLSELGYSPTLFFGDGYKGLPAYAPYDGILVTCGAPTLPEKLIEQLKVGGQIVIPIGETGAQTMFRFTKNSDGTLHQENFGDCAFVPMLEKGVR